MSRNLRKSRRRQAGVTLIEVLVALFIFSLGILGIVGLQARAIQLSVDGEDRTRGALMANEIVSTMWAQGTVTLPAATVSAWVSRVQDLTTSGLPGANGTVSSPDANGIVTVTVMWKAPNKVAADADNTYVTRVVMP